MSLEHELNRLKQNCRIQTAVIGCGLLVALALSGWSAFAKREERTTPDYLTVRTLSIENEDGEVAARLFANDDGHGQLTLQNSEGQVGLMLSPQKIYVFNTQEELCAGMLSDDDGFGAVLTTTPEGDALALIGRGEDDTGTVAVFGRNGKRVYLSTRSDAPARE